MAAKKKTTKRKGYNVLQVSKSGASKKVLGCPSKKAADAAARKLQKQFADNAYLVSKA